MKLQDYRKLLGLTRVQVAEQLRTTGTTIYRYETGRMFPSPKTATRIRDWSKGAVTLDDLLGGKS